MKITRLDATADIVERYIGEHLFDDRDLMYSGIDSQTGRPFEHGFITPQKVPLRASIDPWSYWTYEDSVLSTGLYLDGLVLKYEVTRESGSLERAHRIWTIIERIYSASQVYGPGSFLRPYGGILNMGRFIEPLGTDQASPLFSGLFRYRRYTEGERSADVRRVMLETLRWYERQGFKYFYYKSFVHGSMRSTCHSNSYYLPAVSWAAEEEPDDPRWGRYREIRLGLYERGEARLQPRNGHPTFSWGSDLDVLRVILGPRFSQVFTDSLLGEASEAVKEILDGYEKPGMFNRICPESAETSFKPYYTLPDRRNDPEWKTLMAFGYYYTRHHGRSRPRHESHVLLALASAGYKPEETTRRAEELLALRSRVPEDFTSFLSDDYDLLPETVHLYARSVGVNMVGWWRDYWLLRHIRKRAEEGLL